MTDRHQIDVDDPGDRPDAVADDLGVPAEDLTDEDLLRELAHLHETRHDALLHAPTAALAHHSQRSAALELEYLRRYPERNIDPARSPATPEAYSGS
jgi:hypothetical protein